MTENSSPNPHRFFRGLGRLRDQIGALLQDFDLEENAERLAGDARQLADMGWTIASDMVPVETARLVEEHTPETLDEWFLDHHHTPDGRELSRLRPRLLHDEAVTARWVPILEPAFDAYEAGHSPLIVPALLTVLEGTIAQTAGRLRTRDIDVEGMAADLTDQTDKLEFAWVVYHSIQAFTDNLFEDHPFSASRPSLLNRHWILHGRDEPDWTDADALRLFQALETLGLAADPVE